jgi:leucyl aminopeptidase (aminopeptidase T)
MNKLVSISEKLLLNSLDAKHGEKFLIITDDSKEKLARQLYIAGKGLNLSSMFLKISFQNKAGEEPPKSVAEAMKYADIVICITEYSLTHTKAVTEAAFMGARIATMPGITEDMFMEGAINADYKEVEKLTKKISKILTQGSEISIEKNGYNLKMSIEGRKGIESTGRLIEKGQKGNLPSGETYIAPIEGTACGKILIDGSIVGLGKLKSPILLTVEEGLLIDAQGENADKWLKILGSSKAARNIAEFGVGTNSKARLTGNILEDEKILGTIHIAFGTNEDFGGKVNAGIHLDAIILQPTFYIDGKLLMDKGKLTI